jgi:hypothetical protein
MQLKYRKSLFLIVFVPIILLLLLLTVNKQQFSIIKEDLNQEIISLDLGFSSFRNLLDDGNSDGAWEEYSASKKIIAFFKNTPNIFKYKFLKNKDHTIEKIFIDIKFKNYKKIILDRGNAVKKGQLINPTIVNASLRYRGGEYDAKLRLKGDLSDHWLSSKRMSFRVKLKNKETIFGFNRFSIQKPRARQQPYDYVFQSLMRDVGNLASVHNFAHVFVNGVDWGVMDLEEHISKEFLEKQKRKESAVIRFSNENKWAYIKKTKNPYLLYRLSDPSLYVKLYSDKKYLNDYWYRKVYSYILKQHREYNPILYDTDRLAKAHIMANAWGDFHTLQNNNSRYYFNPYTLKLEPITTDASLFSSIDKLEDIRYFYKEGQYLSAFSSPSYKAKLDENLFDVGSIVFNKIQHHLDVATLPFPLEKKKNPRIVKDNMRKIINNKEYYLMHLPEKWSLKKDLDPKKNILPTKQQASEFKEHLHIRHYTDGTLELYNLLPDNVSVEDILFNGTSISIKDTVVPSYLLHSKPTVIKTPYKGIQDDMFTVNTKYQGFNRTIKNDITLVSDGIDNLLLLDTVSKFDFINKLDSNTFEIKQGNWTVNKPIIVGGDLHILPGVNLQFSEDAYIVVKGSLTAIGGEENPITLKAVSDSWKGIYVLNADKKSRLKNVSISNLSALEDELLKLTGGITFYKSDVDFENVRINDIKAEDALNIVESKFTLNSVYINNTASDGLDSDFSKGSVLNSEFSDIGGDALDFSGSNVSIRTTEANNVKDKAVSAGEKSTLTVKNSAFNNIGVGIASKDGSSVTVADTNISNYKLYGAMTYLKKGFYDMPSLTINNSSVSDGRAYIRQKGTSMVVDGIDIPETKISVKKLYKTRVMAK